MEKNVNYPQIMEIRGFLPNEKVSIVAPDIRTASVELGKSMADSVDVCLLKIRKDDSYQKMEKSAKDFYKKLIMLREKNDLRLSNGQDPFTDYFNALHGYCEGAGVNVVEGIMLQLGMDIGCQTLMFKDKGEIYAIHTEEDGDEFMASGDASQGKKMVEMKIGNKKVTFLAYPGLCSFGPAFCLVEDNKHKFFMANDFLSAEDEENEQGLLLNHLVTFMIADCGRIDLVGELVSKLETVKAKRFIDGAVVTLAESGKDVVDMASLEFAADKISFVKPVKAGAREIYTGVNYPRGEKLREESWMTTQDGNSISEQAYRRRQRRLELVSVLTNPKDVDALLKIIANPYGDIVREDGEPSWNSGLPNKHVAAHVALIMSAFDTKMIVGKKLPPPIEGKEYTTDLRKRKFVSKVIQ